MKILLADDSQFMRTILKGMLSKAFPDATFVEAATGTDTLKKWREHHPDLLLLDLVMPEKGGLEVLKEIGTLRSGKVIIVSALGQEGVMQEAIALGSSAFIVKPFDEKQVLDTIRTTLKAA